MSNELRKFAHSFIAGLCAAGAAYEFSDGSNVAGCVQVMFAAVNLLLLYMSPAEADQC